MSGSSCLPRTWRARARPWFTCAGARRPAAMHALPACSPSSAAERDLESKPLQSIDQANHEAQRRIIDGEPILVDVVPASQPIPRRADTVICHAGPPIGWERMCGPLRGAVTGIAVFEGWAADLDAAAAKAAAGTFAFHPNHHFGAVGPMTGMTTRSQPLLVVENKTFGNRA